MIAPFFDYSASLGCVHERLPAAWGHEVLSMQECLTYNILKVY